MANENKTKSVVDQGHDPEEKKGETFWLLVYVFMAFAIFEVLCVALFFIHRCRLRRKEKRKAPAAETPANYDNHGMQENTRTVTPPPVYPEQIELYENDASTPRYSSIQQLQPSLKLCDELNSNESGIPVNAVVPEQRSRQNSRLSQGHPIFVVPKECVIVHASGSCNSCDSRHTMQQGQQEDAKTREIGTQSNNGPSEDNRSLYSWGSTSSCYRTSTDEDYGSGSNKVNWEQDSYYEEPDKVIQSIRMPQKLFGHERLSSPQEPTINTVEKTSDNVVDADDNGECSSENSNQINDNRGFVDDSEDYSNADTCVGNAEHIYESAEELMRDSHWQYYENAYDLPQDALEKCLGKPNKFALKHVLHESNTGDSGPGLNLGMEFVNNNDSMIEGVDVKLRPTRRSTLYLQKGEDDSDHRGRASSC